MRTFVLPGYSLKNKDWAYQVKSKLQEFDVEVIEWLHWNGENIKFDPQREAERVANEIGDERVDIIAKSLGTLAACYLIPNIKVGKIIFCGIPLNDMDKNDYSQYKILKNLKNIIIFQNDKDRHGTFLQSREFVGKINPEIKIVEKRSDTHDYPYYEDFQKFLK